MKKLVANLLCGAVALGAIGTLASCGDDKNEIKVLINRTDLRNTVLKEASAKFAEAFKDKGWKVKFEAHTDYEGDVQTKMSGKKYGDVLLIPTGTKLEDLSTYFAELGTLEELEKKWNYVTNKAFDGKVYGLPTYASPVGMLYNTKVFADAGIKEIPDTPDEFLQAMRTLKEKNKDNSKFVPYMMNFAEGWPLNQWASAMPLVAGDRGDANYETDALPWDDKTFEEGGINYQIYELMYNLAKEDLIEDDLTSKQWELSKVEFVNGNVGAMVLGGWAIPQFQAVATEKGVDLGVVGYMPLPYKAKDGKTYSQISADYMMGIAKNSKKQEIGKAFLTWFLEDFKYNNYIGGISGLKSETEYPDSIKAFQDAGVVFIDTKATTYEEAKNIAYVKSNLNMWDEAWKKTIVTGAKEGKSYAEITAKLSADWKRGVEEVRKTYPQSPDGQAAE